RFQSFMVGKPDSLEFTGKSATPELSIKTETLPEVSRQTLGGTYESRRHRNASFSGNDNQRVCRGGGTCDQLAGTCGPRRRRAKLACRSVPSRRRAHHCGEYLDGPITASLSTDSSHRTDHCNLRAQLIKGGACHRGGTPGPGFRHESKRCRQQGT